MALADLRKARVERQVAKLRPAALALDEKLRALDEAIRHHQTLPATPLTFSQTEKWLAWAAQKKRDLMMEQARLRAELQPLQEALAKETARCQVIERLT